MSAIARALPPSECLHIYVYVHRTNHLQPPPIFICAREIEMNRNPSACSHGFGVGPAGAKFKFAQQYLKSHELHAPAWHVPTFAELGMPQIPSTSYSLNVAAGTPKAVVDKLFAATQQAMQQQQFRDQMAKLNMVVIADTTEQAAKKLADDARFYAEIAKKIGL